MYRYKGRDFRKKGKCDPKYHKQVRNSIGANPTVCRNPKHPGCTGVNPCSTVFVKYGGEALMYGLVPNVTLSRVAQEDNVLSISRGIMCRNWHDYLRMRIDR